MKRLMACLVLLMGLVCLAPVRDAEAANWVWVDSTDYATISIDASSANRYNGKIYYWDQWEYIDSAELNARIKELDRISREYGKNIDYSDLRFTKARICAYTATNGTTYHKILEALYYDSHWNVIDMISVESDWMPIPPDTIAEEEYKKARSYAH